MFSLVMSSGKLLVGPVGSHMNGMRNRPMLQTLLILKVLPLSLKLLQILKGLVFLVSLEIRLRRIIYRRLV